MPIAFSCPQCRRSLRVKDQLAGLQIYCPDCKGVLSVPQSSEAIKSEIEAPESMRAPAADPYAERHQEPPAAAEDPYAERYQETPPAAKKPILPPEEDDEEWDDAPPPKKVTPTPTQTGGGFAAVLGGIGLVVLSIVVAVGGFAIGILPIKLILLLFIVGVVMFFKGLFARE
jgi:Zn-finger nucleic acid-binding protein